MSVAPDTTASTQNPTLSSATKPNLSSRRKIKQPGFVGVILNALHPKVCLQACHCVADDDETDRAVSIDEIVSKIFWDDLVVNLLDYVKKGRS